MIHTKEFWLSQDWSYRDSAVARKTGVHYATVRSNREKLGIPKGTKSDIFPIWEEQDWTLCDAEISRLTKLPQSTVSKARERLGIPPGHIADRRRSEEVITARRKAVIPLEAFVERDTPLARRYGISRERVRQLRKAAGLPSSRTIQKS